MFLHKEPLGHDFVYNFKQSLMVVVSDQVSSKKYNSLYCPPIHLNLEQIKDLKSYLIFYLGFLSSFCIRKALYYSVQRVGKGALRSFLNIFTCLPKSHLGNHYLRNKNIHFKVTIFMECLKPSSRRLFLGF